MPHRPKNTRYWHFDFQIGGCRFHGSCGTEDYAEAKAIEAQARVNAKNGMGKTRAGVFTVAEALGTYYADVAAGQSSARVTLSQGKSLMALIPPTTKLPDLTPAMVQRYVTTRRADHANGTVNRELSLLDRALRHMGRIHAATLPALDLRAMKTPEAEERIRELTLAEQSRLFEHLRTDLHPLVTMALMTGLRLSEMVRMKWTSVDLDARRLTFVQKGAKTRHFPINDEMRAFLSSLPRANAANAAPFVLTFVNQATAERGVIVGGGSVMRDFRKAVVAAGVQNFRFHDLRHTFATRLLRQTGNLKLVSRLLGHSSIDTTMRYAHVLDEDMRQALDGYRVTTPIPKKTPNKRISR